MAGELVVIKIGGAAGVNLPAVCQDIGHLCAQGKRVVIVHGGSARVDQLAAEAGMPILHLTSPSGHVSRYTDIRMREIYVAGLRSVNAAITDRLSLAGLHPIGLTLPDCCALIGERKRHLRHVCHGRIQIVRDDYSGHIYRVRGDFIHRILALGQVPVIPALAHSARDGFLNVDGDRAAAAVAGAMSAALLILLSNVPGLFRDYPTQDDLVSRVPLLEIDSALHWAKGRMKQKILSVKQAAEHGVARAAIADGRLPNPLQRAMAGSGTWFD
jgi:acetylglutamate/LysW-gamma-L-alpha-aminoadipate kinase